MTFKTVLLRGAGLGAVAALALGATAHAQTETPKPAYKHHKHYVAPAPANAAALDEIRALKAEVDDLKARLDAQGQAQQATAAQVAQTQTQVQEVAANAESAQAKVETIPEQVNVAVGQLPKPKPSWADKTQVGSTVFADFSNIDQKNNGAPVAPSGTAFDIKRAYLTVDHQFNDIYSANLTTDFQYTTAGGLNTTELFIKKAYVQAKYFNWLTIRAGSADLPWVPFVESLYGYRYVEKVLIDETSFGTSADWGVHVLGSLDPLGSPTGPVVSYQVSAIDGTGYKAPPGTSSAPRTDTLDLEGRLSVKWMDFTAGIGGYTGKLGKDASAITTATTATSYSTSTGFNSLTSPIPITHHTASRFDAVLAYTGGPFRAGVEYFSADDWTAVTSVAPDKADGYSVFGSYQFLPQWAIFGRYDDVKPNKLTASAKEFDYYNIGLGYTPVKGVDISFVYKHDEVDHGTFATSNGTIGNTATVAGKSNDGTYDEVGVFTQLKY
jgi:hypothetical protein